MQKLSFFISRFLITTLLLGVYGHISILSIHGYGIWMNISSGYEDVYDFGIIKAISVVLIFYLYFFFSSFNIITLILIIFKKKNLNTSFFSKYIFRISIVLLVSYLSALLIKYFFFMGEVSFLKLGTWPKRIGDRESATFWGNIVISTILFYSWFLPLWYYTLGDWFWRRGKWAKID